MNPAATLAGTGEVLLSLLNPFTPLIQLPCNCIVELRDLAVPEEIGLAVLECTCGATFSEEDLYRWARGDGSLIPTTLTQKPPNPLFRFGKTVIEFLGRCDCGVPIVRENGGKEFHLNVPSDAVELLWN